jgi:hypothetical protein
MNGGNFSKRAVTQMSKYIIQEEISIADIFSRSVADPGSGAFVTPGSGIWDG